MKLNYEEKSIINSYHDYVNMRKPCIRETVLKNGTEFASNYELVMLILGSGTQKYPVSLLAKKVLSLINKNDHEHLIENLQLIEGIGPTKAILIAAALELGKRVNAHTGTRINKPEDIIPLVQHYALEPQEYFLSILLNGAHAVQKIEVVSVGTINKAIIHPREIFSTAIKERSVAIIICHNHPSGQEKPSSEDLEITSQLLKAAKLLGIQLLDHIIITQNSFFSFVEHDLLSILHEESVQ